MTVACKCGFAYTQWYAGDGPTAWKEPWVHLSPTPVHWLEVDGLKLAIETYFLHNNCQMQQVSLFVCLFPHRAGCYTRSSSLCPDRACFPKSPWLWLDSSHLPKVLVQDHSKSVQFVQSFYSQFLSQRVAAWCNKKYLALYWEEVLIPFCPSAPLILAKSVKLAEPKMLSLWSGDSNTTMGIKRDDVAKAGSHVWQRIKLSQGEPTLGPTFPRIMD